MKCIILPHTSDLDAIEDQALAKGAAEAVRELGLREPKSPVHRVLAVDEEGPDRTRTDQHLRDGVDLEKNIFFSFFPSI